MSGQSLSRAQLIGAALVILSTVAIALVPSLARLSYDGGSNTMTVITLRSVFSVAVMLLLLILLRQPIRIARRPMLIALASGATYGAMLYCYLGAVNFLPVNLVILIFFLHPLLVGLIAATVGMERLTWSKLACLVAALAGLALAVGLSLDGLDLHGLLLALGSAVALALVIVGNARAMREAPTIPVLFFMMLGAAAVLSVPLAVSQGLALPATETGWVGMLGVALAATFGSVAFFTGMERVGAVRAAMISNLEPVLGIAVAVALLGERLSWPQAVGLLLVVGSIFAMERMRTRPAQQPA